MSSAPYDLIQIFRRAFNLPGYSPIVTINRVELADNYNQMGRQQKEAQRNSLLGTPIFFPCKLDDVELPNEPLIEISGSKSIVRTAIDGMDGTFKELYALNDYVITIRGIAISDDDSYPEAFIRDLKNLFEKKKEIRIVNDLTGYFRINNIVIESMSLPSVEGAQSFQPYQLNCYSDKKIDLKTASGTIE